MILSDRTIRAEIEAGRIGIEPFDPAMIQPSSVDLRLDHRFLVFRSHTRPVIDVKQDLSDLTELVEVEPESAFILHPGEFVLGSTAERVALPDDLVGRIEGKALAVSTPVPTPFGWRTMGELAPGDVVFDGDGRPTMVVAATDVMEDRPCFELEFSDGTTVIADLTHQWVTNRKRDRKRGDHTTVRPITTMGVAASIKSGREYDHQVPLCPPVEYPRKDLPIDPYVLGVWLGGCLSDLDDPVELPSEHQLRRQGLLGDKHVPSAYLTAAEDQRLALLQGLLDSDGHADELGRVEFCSTREQLALATFELAASLGFRPNLTKDTAWLNGIDCGPRYRVRFAPDRPVFRLSRKNARLKPATTRFHRHRSIRAVRRIPSVPVRCIQVAAPSGEFLCTRAFIRTHNSSLGRLGLLIHTTAGFVDAGFEGYLTLEFSNVATLPITLYPGMKIGQISFLRMDGPAEHPYGTGQLGSKYRGQVGPTASQYWKNFES